MIFLLCKWYFDNFFISWHKQEKRWANVFQIYPNSIHLNPLQFCPPMPLLGFAVFCLSSSIVLNRYFHILVNSMTIWSVLKLPKVLWPSPFNFWLLGKQLHVVLFSWAFFWGNIEIWGKTKQLLPKRPVMQCFVLHSVQNVDRVSAV